MDLDHKHTGPDHSHIDDTDPDSGFILSGLKHAGTDVSGPNWSFNNAGLIHLGSHPHHADSDRRSSNHRGFDVPDHHGASPSRPVTDFTGPDHGGTDRPRPDHHSHDHGVCDHHCGGSTHRRHHHPPAHASACNYASDHDGSPEEDDTFCLNNADFLHGASAAAVWWVRVWARTALSGLLLGHILRARYAGLQCRWHQRAVPLLRGRGIRQHPVPFQQLHIHNRALRALLLG
mmetsp:Transcript_60151/g.166474  ORF Transcript_60151/g.166474 Transcript_60151/m.166474 type:complete len:232 (+) Transcript_60151:1814-2509(+)